METEILKARVKFGKRLRGLRKKMGWTQTELAQKAHINIRHIQRLEGKRPSAVEIDSIIKISKAFQIKPAQLFDY